MEINRIKYQILSVSRRDATEDTPNAIQDSDGNYYTVEVYRNNRDTPIYAPSPAYLIGHNNNDEYLYVNHGTWILWMVDGAKTNWIELSTKNAWLWITNNAITIDDIINGYELSLEQLFDLITA